MFRITHKQTQTMHELTSWHCLRMNCVSFLFESTLNCELFNGLCHRVGFVKRSHLWQKHTWRVQRLNWCFCVYERKTNAILYIWNSNYWSRWKFPVSFKYNIDKMNRSTSKKKGKQNRLNKHTHTHEIDRRSERTREKQTKLNWTNTRYRFEDRIYAHMSV
jgi:hypothetical protein